MIVHGVGTSRCSYVYHYVEAGDAGIFGLLINGVVAITFTPLRLLEQQYWNLIQPPGSTIWEENRNKFESCKNQL